MRSLLVVILPPAFDFPPRVEAIDSAVSKPPLLRFPKRLVSGMPELSFRIAYDAPEGHESTL
jgi:hypothetical protein